MGKEKNSSEDSENRGKNGIKQHFYSFLHREFLSCFGDNFCVANHLLRAKILCDSVRFAERISGNSLAAFFSIAIDIDKDEFLFHFFSPFFFLKIFYHKISN
jgi:hypothetical protein